MIPVPPRMAHLDLDPRGYPIFFMAFRDKSGRPHFTINDETKRQHVIENDLCSICGKKLLRGRWFIGGPLSAFDPQGAYLDPPMHHECLRYALVVCPYLAMPVWSNYIAGRTLAKDEDALTVIDPSVVDERPDVFVAVMATVVRKITGHIVKDGIALSFTQYLKPHQPYTRVEYWKHGRQIFHLT